MSIAEKLQQFAVDYLEIAESKEAIRQAIIAKGVEVAESVHLAAFPDAIAAIASGGSTVINGATLTYITPFGDIIGTETCALGSTPTPPEPPIISGVTFTGWVNLPTHVAEDAVVGAAYSTAPGVTMLFIEVTDAAALQFTLWLYKFTVADMIIDFGTGTPYTISGSGVKSNNKTYPSVGKYTVTLTCADQYMIGTSGGHPIFTKIDATTNYNSILRAAYLANKVRIFYHQFETAYGLKNILLSSGVSLYQTTDDELFYDCRALKTLIIPSTLVRINGRVFTGCYSLEYIILQAITSATASYNMGVNNYSLKYMNSEAITGHDTSGIRLYSSAYSIKKSRIKEGVTIVGLSCFWACYALEEVILPQTLITIGNQVFYDCRSLRNITIPPNVTSIGTSVFGYTYALQEMILQPVTPPTWDGTMSQINARLKIYVPDASLAAYKAAAGWSTKASIIFPISQR